MPASEVVLGTRFEDRDSSHSNSSRPSDSTSKESQTSPSTSTTHPRTDTPTATGTNTTPDAFTDGIDPGSYPLLDQSGPPSDFVDDASNSDIEDLPQPSALGEAYARNDKKAYDDSLKLLGYSYDAKTNGPYMKPGMFFWTPVSTPIVPSEELDELEADAREDYVVYPTGHMTRKVRRFLAVQDNGSQVLCLKGTSRNKRGFTGLTRGSLMYKKLVALIHRRDWENGFWQSLWRDIGRNDPIIIETGEAGPGSMILLEPELVSKRALVMPARETISYSTFEQVVYLFYGHYNPDHCMTSAVEWNLDMAPGKEGSTRRPGTAGATEDRRGPRRRPSDDYGRQRSRSPFRHQPEHGRTRTPPRRSYSPSYGYDRRNRDEGYHRAISPTSRYQNGSYNETPPHSRPRPHEESRNTSSAGPQHVRETQQQRGRTGSRGRGLASGKGASHNQDHRPRWTSANDTVHIIEPHSDSAPNSTAWGDHREIHSSQYMSFANSSSHPGDRYQEDGAVNRGRAPGIASLDKHRVQTSAQQAPSTRSTRRRRGGNGSHAIEAVTLEFNDEGAREPRNSETTNRTQPTSRMKPGVTSLANAVGNTKLNSIQPVARGEQSHR
ncbi:hypothetical protein M409DRAFT_18233 [Zasmidium cellare ATCC 36951]|uniref:Uncharacterized protein n=1 Tax=Zasmidium cellare ATCC 36951 TaxID=1080233 RepID=A0A6A6D1F8_ZASCE|nr:uncharacterized protein M409DRAFT_18233 [Zasmidium cellare ATCC 36951]KAF2172002.1 hypothetical protein M409DRAFT_18233 [Zasmidium cellare ATCC 36951]